MRSQIRSPGNDAQSINSADWVVLTKNKDLLAKLRPVRRQTRRRRKPPVLWTDAHSSLFEILRTPASAARPRRNYPGPLAATPEIPR